MNPATGPAVPCPGHVLRGQRAAVSAASGRRLRRVRQFREQFACLLVIFADVADTVVHVPDICKSFAVHRHTVPLRRIEIADHVSFLIEVDHRRRPLAAIRDRRIQLGLEFDIRQVVRTIERPDVVVFVHGQTGYPADLPFVWQRLRPIRIELELWRRFRRRSTERAKEPCTQKYRAKRQ